MGLSAINKKLDALQDKYEKNLAESGGLLPPAMTKGANDSIAAEMDKLDLQIAHIKDNDCADCRLSPHGEHCIDCKFY